jgi:uncharacterized membrane protein
MSEIPEKKQGVYTFNSGIKLENFENLYSSANTDVIALYSSPPAAMNFSCTNTENISTVNLTMTEETNTNSNGFWKYDEDKTLKEIEEYLVTTYKSHYTSETSKTQTLDLIESIGDAEPFVRSNAIKYLSRFGKKNGKSKMDILKAIHYCILLYHFAGLHNETAKSNYETF